MDFKGIMRQPNIFTRILQVYYFNSSVEVVQDAATADREEGDKK